MDQRLGAVLWPVERERRVIVALVAPITVDDVVVWVMLLCWLY